MDIQSKLQLLKQFRTRTAKASSPAERVLLRVATRWLVADLMTEYDAVMRLQILEGAAGVASGTWTGGKNSRTGLKEAISHFSVREDTKEMDPAWLSPRPSGMSHIAFDIAAAEIRRWSVGYTLPMEPFDVLNGMIMGVGVKGEVWKSGKPLFRLGQNEGFGSKILKGAETPAEVARTGLGVFIKNRVEAFSKSTRLERNQLPVDEEGGVRDIPGRPKNEDLSPDEMLVNVVFRDRNDSLGKKIRRLMRISWADTPQQKAMDLWLDAFESTGRFPRKQDISEAAGYAQPISFSKAWKVAWTKFFKELWKSTNIIKELEQRFEDEGVEWIPKPPADFDEVLQRAKQASLRRRVANRVASR
jgi:hypothetical protein